MGKIQVLSIRKNQHFGHFHACAFFIYGKFTLYLSLFVKQDDIFLLEIYHGTGIPITVQAVYHGSESAIRCSKNIPYAIPVKIDISYVLSG